MTIEAHNLTHSEYYRLNGLLSVERTEQVLVLIEEGESLSEAVEDFTVYAKEAIAQYPAEDFLTEQVESLQDFAKRLRGSNKQDLSHIIESISDALQCQFNASDYGIGELKKIK